MKIKALIYTAAMAAMVVPAFAYQGSNQGTSGTGLKQEIKENRCEMAQNRIEAKINLFNANKEPRTEVYNDIVARIQNIVDRLKESGADVSKLTADLETLESKIETYWSTRNAFMEKLQTSKGTACGQNATEFKNSMTQAREAHKQMVANGQEIRKFISETIKVDIKAVRDSIKSSESN